MGYGTSQLYLLSLKALQCSGRCTIPDRTTIFKFRPDKRDIEALDHKGRKVVTIGQLLAQHDTAGHLSEGGSNV